MIALVPALAGALVVAGIIGLFLGLRPAPVRGRRPATRRMRRLGDLNRRTRMLVLGGLAGGALAWLVTGWVLAIVAVPVAAVGLPMLLSVFGLFFTLATPINNTITRVQETEADRFGLALSREPHGFAEAQLRLVEYRKADPGPVEEFVFFHHPSTRGRILDAMRYREAMNLP